MNHLDVWYFHLDLEGILAMVRGMTGRKVIQKHAKCDAERPSKRTHIETFPKLSEAVNGQYRIKDDPQLISHLDPLEPGRDNLDTEAWKACVLEYLASLPEERRVIIFAEPIQIKI